MHHLSWRRAFTALLASTCAAGFSASTALAGSSNGCYADYRDSAGETWDIYGNIGAVSDGTSDTYDTYGFLSVGDVGSDDWDRFSDGACSFEEDGRELVTVSDPLTFRSADGQRVVVDAQRKVYVPAAGQAFARWLDILTNTSDAPVTFNYKWSGDYGEIGHPNTDDHVRSADGDSAIGVGEAWGAFRHDYNGNAVASLWDGLGSDGWDAPFEEGYFPGVDGSDWVDYVYNTVTLHPGESAVFMHIEHQTRPTYSDDVSGEDAEIAALEAAADFARTNAAGSPAFFTGMSANELSDLRNWRADGDGDGIENNADNCRRVANTGQSDIDRDGFGDACDADIDGDGLTNAQEQSMGTNAASANSDGDALADGVDRCPTLRGDDAEGCPPPAMIAQQQSAVQTLRRLTPRGLTSKVVRTRGASTLTLRTSGRLRLPKGTGRKLCVKSTVAVQVKSGTRTVSMRRVALRPDCTYRSSVTFKALSRLTGRLTVTAQFMGNGRLLRQSATPRTVAGA